MSMLSTTAGPIVVPAQSAVIIRDSPGQVKLPTPIHCLKDCDISVAGEFNMGLLDDLSFPSCVVSTPVNAAGLSTAGDFMDLIDTDNITLDDIYLDELFMSKCVAPTIQNNDFLPTPNCFLNFPTPDINMLADANTDLTEVDAKVEPIISVSDTSSSVEALDTASSIASSATSVTQKRTPAKTLKKSVSSSTVITASSTSTMDATSKVRRRRPKRFVPPEEQTNEYKEFRRINTERARRSRMKAKQRAVELQVLLPEAEERNAQLLESVKDLRTELATLRCLVRERLARFG